MFEYILFFTIFPVHPVINVRNQLVGSPFEKDVTIECNVEASPKSINYWIKDTGLLYIYIGYVCFFYRNLLQYAYVNLSIVYKSLHYPIFIILIILINFLNSIKFLIFSLAINIVNHLNF